MTELLALVERQERIQQICKDNALDFTIHKIPLYGVFEDEPINSSYYGLLNDKTKQIIHSVKEGYRVTQTDEIIGLALDGTQKFPNLTVSKGGSINGGRKTFIQFQINGMNKINGEDIKRFITIMDSNDGSTRLMVGIGNKVMSCMNQYHYFAAAAQSRFKHSASIEEKLDELPLLIEAALATDIRLMEIYTELADKTCSRDLIDTLVHRLVGCDRTMSKEDLAEMSMVSQNKMNKLYDHIAKETREKGMNLWGVQNGVTSWTSHDKSVPRRPNGRDESAMVGSNYETNNKSLAFVMARGDISW